jgi:hypothetical protein
MTAMIQQLRHRAGHNEGLTRGTNRGVHPAMRLPTIIKPIALERAAMLRIRNGQGTRVRVTSGALWVTEEDSPADHMLLPGDGLDLTRRGTAIVFADLSPARIVIEVPPGVALPRAVDMVLANGERRRVALGDPMRQWARTGVGGAALTFLGNALASLRRRMAVFP